MAHTDTPWTLTEVSGGDALIGEFEIRGVFLDKENVYPIFQNGRDVIEGASVYLHPDDARYIVRAVNAFEPLVRALKACQLQLLQSNNQTEWAEEANQLAVSALALADKESSHD